MKNPKFVKLILTFLLSALFFTSGCTIIAGQFLSKQGDALVGSRNLKVGDVISSEYQMNTNSCKAIILQGDTEVQLDCKLSFIKTDNTEVLEVQNGEASKLKKTNISDTTNHNFIVNGKTEETKINGAFHQKSILLQKTNGVWSATLMDGKLTEEQAKLLKEESFGLDLLDLGYPSKPVKIGESWDMSKYLRLAFSSDFIIKSSSFNGTLKEIVQYQGEKCALIESVGDIQGIQRDSSNNEVEVKMSMKLITYRSLSSFSDIDSQAKGILTFQYDQIESGKKSNIKITGNYELTGKDIILRKSQGDESI